MWARTVMVHHSSLDLDSHALPGGKLSGTVYRSARCVVMPGEMETDLERLVAA